jgi:hypothetical protein
MIHKYERGISEPPVFEVSSRSRDRRSCSIAGIGVTRTLKSRGWAAIQTVDMKRGYMEA